MDIQQVVTLIESVSNANIMNFQIEEGSFKLSMDKLTQRMDTFPQNVGTNITPSTCADLEEKTSIQYEKQNVNIHKVVNETVDINKNETIVVEDVNVKVVESPIVGTYYSAAGPDTEDFVKVGDKVTKGKILCIVEAMKLMNDIESEFDGEIVEIFVNNEQMVEFGQPLFKIRV